MSDEMEYLPEWAGPIVARMAGAERLGLRITVSRVLMRVDFTRSSPNVGYTLTPEESAETMEVGLPIVENAIRDIHKLLKEVEDQARIIHDLREDRDTVYLVEEIFEHETSSVVTICGSLVEARRAVEVAAKLRNGMVSDQWFYVSSCRAGEFKPVAVFAADKWACLDCRGTRTIGRRRGGQKCPTCNGTGEPSLKP